MRRKTVLIATLCASILGALTVASPASAESAPTAPSSIGVRTGTNYADVLFADSSTNESGWRVETRTPGGTWQLGRIVTDTSSGQPASTGTVYTVSFQNLSVPVEYCYRIGAFNSAGTSYTKSICTAPRSPGDVEVVSKTTTSLTIRWRDRAVNERFTDLYLGYFSDHQFTVVKHWGALADQNTITTTTVSGLKSHVAYEFFLRAQNNVGYGESTHQVEWTLG